MKIVIWLMQVLLAVVFLSAGVMKWTTPKDDLIAQPNMRWAADFSQTQVRLIGAAEILGAVGLVVPAATGILTWLSPVAAVGLSLLMAGAGTTLIGRGETPTRPLALAVLAVMTAVLLFRGRAA